ncbi:hypothetical protein [Burkholderia lata]|uniref:hypothetical protein n=1 Tax=Burkholderia lata (strain ATCC 17760 / DSM 23089 / LMG 22485 / NCIMB 9086 / R18194 / 383) TaxID=482957 RepID=UPI001453D690|nr:hypothetical protein [Burkholderia lata]VWB88284.1 hypothetical protein BLA15816_04244 [Burkholderia lata]
MSVIAADEERMHLRVWEMLPWIVNDTASADDLREVHEHLGECVLCRAELARQRWLQTAMNQREPQTQRAERGFEKLLKRIDDAQLEVDAREARAPQRMQTQAPAKGRPGRSVALAYGLAAMVLLETGALAVLCGQIHGQQPAVYRTLSEVGDPSHQATIRLVVDNGISPRLQALLVAQHLRIVNGPGENGVYSLAPSGVTGDTNAQVAVLRTVPGVRFAEPATETLNAQ